MTRHLDRWRRVLRFLSGARGTTTSADTRVESSASRECGSTSAPRNEPGDDAIPLAELITASAYLGFDAAEWLRPRRPLPDVDGDDR